MKKESLFAAIDQRQVEILAWGNAFFDCAELGFQEVKTAAAITALLDQWNIPYESGIAMTGIRVTLGSGSPHIAFVSDMDSALQKQKRHGPFLRAQHPDHVSTDTDSCTD